MEHSYCNKSCHRPCEPSCHKPCETSCYRPCEPSCHIPCESSCDKPCETCITKLYDIITYCDANEKEFNVIINSCYLPIQGFILAFVDEYGKPIIFNDCNSFMKIESITPCPIGCYPPVYNYYYNEICPFADKYYYTYTIQEYNCMPINPALWSYYVNINVPLKLSFKLDYNYTGRVFLYINMFIMQKQQECKLEPIIRNCIHSDLYLGCVPNPFACGYISWMTNLNETDNNPPSPL